MRSAWNNEHNNKTKIRYRQIFTHFVTSWNFLILATWVDDVTSSSSLVNTSKWTRHPSRVNSKSLYEKGEKEKSKFNGKTRLDESFFLFCKLESTGYSRALNELMKIVLQAGIILFEATSEHQSSRHFKVECLMRLSKLHLSSCLTECLAAKKLTWNWKNDKTFSFCCFFCATLNCSEKDKVPEQQKAIELLLWHEVYGPQFIFSHAEEGKK